MNKNVIAKVDYHDFISGDEAKRAKFIKEFGDSFANMGFAIVSNHGVTEEEKQALYRVSETFFNLPDDIKLQYHDQNNAGQRGYIPKNVETAKGRKVADLKEFYHIGQQLTSEENASMGYPENIFPDELPELEEIVTRFQSGVSIEVGESIASKDYTKIVKQISDLKAPIEKLEMTGAGNVASAVEFIFEGLHLNKRLNKDHVGSKMLYRT